MAVNQNILLTTDAIIFGERNNDRYLLLIQRKNDPFKGQWAFPGGFVEDDEDLDVAAARELQEETHLPIKAENLKQVGTWGTPGRDPRGRTVTVAYTAVVDVNDQVIKAADDAVEVKWWPLDQLPEMAFDHQQILAAVQENVEE